jgi:hypothetical protein
MATYQGKSVTLNKPSRISKGEPGHGRKKFKVYVKDGDKVKKVMFGDPNIENHLELDINAIQQQIKHLQDIGLARCGKEILCHMVQEKIV